MKLTTDLLNSENTIAFASSDLPTRKHYFSSLQQQASEDLSLAHSLFKVSAARLILELASRDIRGGEIGSFSVYKSFDTLTLKNNLLTGKKHWITNLSSASYGIYQSLTQTGVQLCYVDLNAGPVVKDFSFLSTPGLLDTCTGDAIFENHPTEVLFNKTDPRYFISNNFNSLCFIVNYLGAARRLLDCIAYGQLTSQRATFKMLQQALDHEISVASFVAVSTDAFWHQRNALYISIKELLVGLIQYIVSNSAGNFYNLNSPEGQHFYNCLVYSGHDGPISRSKEKLYTFPQDL